MKPKTALQKQVVELSTGLPKITDKQKQYSENKSFENWGTISRNTIYCLECGHSWKEKNASLSDDKRKCPNCNKRLKITANKPLFDEKEYFAVITTVENFQVVRMFLSVKNMRKKETPTYYHIEAMQHWIDENGKCTTMAKATNFMPRYIDSWNYASDLEIRNIDKNDNKFYINPYKIYPTKTVTEKIKRNGFKSSFHNIAPHILFIGLLTDNRAENLLKTNQTSSLNYYLSRYNYEVEKRLSSLRICTKNNYIIKDFSIWNDYLSLLEYFNKDIKNPKYICPADLKNQHDRLVAKKRERQKREDLLKIKKQIKISEKQYKKDKKAFFGLQFTNGEITVKVIDSVQDFLEEGDTLKHCIFTNEYYNKKNSLILSARLKDKPIETVEISLSEMKIIQARGEKNQATKHHEEIIDLVNNNLSLISSRMKKQKTKLSA